MDHLHGTLYDIHFLFMTNKNTLWLLFSKRIIENMPQRKHAAKQEEALAFRLENNQCKTVFCSVSIKFS